MLPNCSADVLRTFLAVARAHIVRNRIKIFDAGFLVVLFSVAALLAFEIDIFQSADQVSPQEKTIELDEVFILSTLVMCGMLFYTWRRAREHKRENIQRLAAEAEVMTLALQDPLTGLPNRRQFDGALKSALRTVPTAPEAHAIFLLDLNGFKKVNDIHGHPIGDQVLIHVGARLLRAARESDLVARLGGDEFAILGPNIAGAEGATSIALRIIESLSAPIVVDGIRHPIGAAIGVAISPQDGITAEELMRKADVALYRAKADRKSAMRFFEERMDASLRERDELERALLHGLERGEFTLRFQPSRATDDRIVSFEALPCWHHPQLGEIEPERFLPVAEEIGVLAQLSEGLLKDACRAAGAWPRDVRLSFNLPRALLGDAAFGLRILAALAETRFAPQRLDLEIDEGALIRDTQAAQALMKPLRSAGISIIADNFGTGYSDLQNLHRLKLDGIKIDRSFIAAMTHNRQAAVIVKALIGIGQGLDLSVTADGVENAAQRAALAAQGCLNVQGELHGDGLDADAAMALFVNAAQAMALPPARI